MNMDVLEKKMLWSFSLFLPESDLRDRTFDPIVIGLP